MGQMSQLTIAFSLFKISWWLCLRHGKSVHAFWSPKHPINSAVFALASKILIDKLYHSQLEILTCK